MPEELKKKIFETIEKALDGGVKGVEMLGEKFPEMVEGYVKYCMAFHSIMAIAFFLVGILFLWMAVTGVKKTDGDYVIPGFLGTLGFGFGFFYNLTSIFHLRYAPMVYIYKDLMP